MKPLPSLVLTLGFTGMLCFGVLKWQATTTPADSRGPEDPAARGAVKNATKEEAKTGGLEEQAQYLLECEDRDSSDLLKVIKAWAGRDPDAALAWAELHLEGIERTRTIDQGLVAWAASDPGRAAAWVVEGRGDPLQERWASIVGGAWAKSSPESAAAWVMKLSNEDVREGAAIAVARGWSISDPLASAEWATVFYEETDSLAPLQSAVESLAQHDIAEARAFVDRMPEDLNYVGVVQVSMEWAKSDPLAAAQWASGLESATSRAGALTGVVGVWAEESPSAAAKFVDSLEDGAKGTAARYLVKEWVETDAVAASAWLQTVPEGEARDEGVGALSDGLMDSDPASAMQWSLTIGDEILREFQVEDVLHSWLVRDRAAAEAWLVDNQVPQEIIDNAMEAALN